MAPLQVILLLLLVRFPAILSGVPASGGPAPAPLVPPLPGYGVVLSLVLSHLFLVLIVAQRAGASARLLHLPTSNASAISHRMDRLLGIGRWCTLVFTAVHLYVLGLPGVVDHWLAGTVVLRRIPLLPETIYIAPAVLAWIGFWTANYQVEAAARERSFPYRLAMGMPAHPMPALSHYLSMQMRHNFYLLLLVGIASLIEETGELLDHVIPNVSEVATPLAIMVAIVLMPWFIVRFWSTVPLRGPLRTRLDALAGAHKLRFRNILIWKTHNQVTNAAILGPFPFARYFLMTDALLETLTDQQIEAVFAHEVGHGVHRHILWYLAGMIGALCLSAGVANLLQSHLPEHVVHVLFNYGITPDGVGFFALIACEALFLAFGFSFVSHRFEHQADWFAARHMATLIRNHPDSVPMPAVSLTRKADPSDLLGDLPDELVEAASPASSTSSVPEAFTLDQYIAGHYPETAPAAAADPLTVVPGTPASLAPTLAAAGVELFVSSLDTIIELAHRSRNKGGWMHPSINNRIELLRKLAANPAAALDFNRRMILTRLVIVAFIVLGIGVFYLSTRYQPTPPPTTEQPFRPDSSGKIFTA